MSVEKPVVADVEVKDGRVFLSLDLSVLLKLVTAWTENKVDDAAEPIISGFIKQLKFQKAFKPEEKSSDEAVPKEEPQPVSE